MSRRIAVTGIGLLTPVGIGNKETWDAVCSGKSGIKGITRFDITDHKTKIGGELTDFNPEDFMNPKEARRTDRFIQSNQQCIFSRTIIDIRTMLTIQANHTLAMLFPLHQPEPAVAW